MKSAVSFLMERGICASRVSGVGFPTARKFTVKQTLRSSVSGVCLSRVFHFAAQFERNFLLAQVYRPYLQVNGNKHSSALMLGV